MALTRLLSRYIPEFHLIIHSFSCIYFKHCNLLTTCLHEDRKELALLTSKAYLLLAKNPRENHSKVLVLTPKFGKLCPCPAFSWPPPHSAFKTVVYLKDVVFSRSFKKYSAVLKDSPVHWIIVQDKINSQSVAIKSKHISPRLAFDYWYSRGKSSFKYKNKKNVLLKGFINLQRCTFFWCCCLVFFFILFYFLGFGVVFLVTWGVVEYFFGF